MAYYFVVETTGLAHRGGPTSELFCFTQMIRSQRLALFWIRRPEMEFAQPFRRHQNWPEWPFRAVFALRIPLTFNRTGKPFESATVSACIITNHPHNSLITGYLQPFWLDAHANPFRKHPNPPFRSVFSVKKKREPLGRINMLQGYIFGRIFIASEPVLICRRNARCAFKGWFSLESFFTEKIFLFIGMSRRVCSFRSSIEVLRGSEDSKLLRSFGLPFQPHLFFHHDASWRFGYYNNFPYYQRTGHLLWTNFTVVSMDSALSIGFTG